MDKRTTLAFLIIGAVLIVWLYLNSPQQPTAPVKQQQDTTTITQTPKPNLAAPDLSKQEKTLQDTSGQSAFKATNLQERVITIENSLVRLELTTKGGKIKRYFLKKYQTWYANEDSADFFRNQVQLVNNDGDFNVEFISKDGKLINTSSADFTTDAKDYHYILKNKDSLTINFTALLKDNGAITKSFVFKGENYAADCTVELKDLGNYISNYKYEVVWANGIKFAERNSVDEATYSNASAYTGGEQVIINADKPGTVIKTDPPLNGIIDWIGIRNKYFAVIIAPLDMQNEGGAYIEGYEKNIREGKKEFYSASIKIPFENKEYQKNSFQLYIGPVDYNILKGYGKHFEKIVDFGSLFGFRPIIRPISEYVLLPLFKFIHLFIPNWGLVIIVFSLIIKIALHPLTRSSLKSMKKMQMLQPKIAEMKEKYKDDPQRVNKETMKLYSTYGINPAGGCLPMLLQMPIFVALWALFNVAVELRHASFALWINNLSTPDVIYTLPFSLPLFGIKQVSGLALLLGITMFFQQKMSVKDPSQKALVYMMPVLFTLMFMGFPSGLNLYYLMFNVFSIAQQYYVNHTHSNVELQPVKNPKKSGGFMTRMMEAAEKQAQKQGTARKK